MMLSSDERGEGTRIGMMVREEEKKQSGSVLFHWLAINQATESLLYSLIFPFLSKYCIKEMIGSVANFFSEQSSRTKRCNGAVRQIYAKDIWNLLTYCRPERSCVCLGSETTETAFILRKMYWHFI